MEYLAPECNKDPNKKNPLMCLTPSTSTCMIKRQAPSSLECQLPNRVHSVPRDGIREGLGRASNQARVKSTTVLLSFY